MSYDLAVYTSRTASRDELAGLLGQGSALQLESVGSDQRSLRAVRGARRRHSFTLDGPGDVEAEDVPAEVTAVLLGARHRYGIIVEGTADAEIPHAVRFARRLAQALDGAVLDQQTDEVWSRSRSRSVRKPTPDERVATVDVGWYCLGHEVSAAPASVFLRAAEELLPEALPRRFGEEEPLQGKLAAAGTDGSSAPGAMRRPCCPSRALGRAWAATSAPAPAPRPTTGTGR